VKVTSCLCKILSANNIVFLELQQVQSVRAIFARRVSVENCNCISEVQWQLAAPSHPIRLCRWLAKHSDEVMVMGCLGGEYDPKNQLRYLYGRVVSADDQLINEVATAICSSRDHDVQVQSEERRAVG
jgi:hypothetical protein